MKVVIFIIIIHEADRLSEVCVKELLCLCQTHKFSGPLLVNTATNRLARHLVTVVSLLLFSHS